MDAIMCELANWSWWQIASLAFAIGVIVGQLISGSLDEKGE